MKLFSHADKCLDGQGHGVRVLCKMTSNLPEYSQRKIDWEQDDVTFSLDKRRRQVVIDLRRTRQRLMSSSSITSSQVLISGNCLL